MCTFNRSHYEIQLQLGQDLDASVMTNCTADFSTMIWQFWPFVAVIFNSIGLTVGQGLFHVKEPVLVTSLCQPTPPCAPC